MRFNYDLLPGQQLTFEEIALRYAQQHPDEKALTVRGLLSPSTSYRTLRIRAVFASEESNSPLEDLLFISDDNERKNYLRRFEHYMKTQASFACFRRSKATQRDNLWQVTGESRVYAMIDPRSPTAHQLLASRGYQLVLMREDEQDAYWQLFDPQSQPCFPNSRRIQFMVVLSTPQHTVPTAVMPGMEVGRRVKASVLQRASQAEFLAAVKARYGGCVITGTRVADNASFPWVETCYISQAENEEGLISDNSADNGLFLRSDLQRLFISKLLKIDAQTGQVSFQQQAMEEATLQQDYALLDGQICKLWHRVPEKTRIYLASAGH
ncbi:HNH endonuclease signature motif containing protein [Pantoea sp. KPR_PJ]|uniref:HNH endonuclease signature motif containing protein n=1 Tax=Pantoea sp. KPR_PJ TaxID=2738375 RepID=UPI003527F1D6